MRRRVPPPSQPLKQALRAFEAGDLAQARLRLSSLVTHRRAHPLALHVLALIEAREGSPQRALDLLERCAALSPDDPLVFANRGNALRELKRLDEALRSYQRAIELRPDYALVHGNKGAVLAELGMHEQALDSYRRALDLDPADAVAHFNMANTLAELRRHDAALVSYARAIQLDPSNANYRCNRSSVLTEIGSLELALQDYDAAIGLQPTHSQAHFDRATVLRRLGRLEEAAASIRKALDIDPHYPFAQGALLYLKRLCCDWSNYHVDRERLERGCLAGERVSAPFEVLSILDVPAAQLAAARTWCEDKYVATKPRPPARFVRRGAKIRLAYLSSDFRNHPVSYLTAELFELHDRERFEVVAVSWGIDDHSDIRQRIAAAADRFVDISAASDLQAARLLRELDIDIAISLNGLTAGERSRILAERVAPVQVNYLGFPGTMGARFIDFVVADHFIVPDDAQACYAEKILYLPDCFQSNDSHRNIADFHFSRAEAGLPRDGFVFCNFGSSHKIDAEIFELWMRLLAKVDGSVLWLANHNPWMVANLAREAHTRGIEAGRLVFGPRMDYARHLARHKLADLCLDTLPFNGGTTTSDALWAGVPVLSCAGRSFAARMGGSLLGALGMSELVVGNLAQYEERALRLAGDRQGLGALRDKLSRQRLAAPLFDSRRYARNLEAAYLEAWEHARH